MGDQASDVDNLERVFNDASAEPINISYGALRLITQNFTQVIGSGGFGLVYLGGLKNGGMVAVKKLIIRMDHLSDSDHEKFNKEFLDEVTVLKRLKHKNIVRFLGYCADTQGEVMDIEGNLRVVEEPQRLFCFEYVPNGNLHHYLKEKYYGFEWNMRYQIIKRICQGLHYLHQERVNHLDLKPDNVLLGAHMEPKITDFGLSRCFVGQQSIMSTKNFFGTRGYIAPELIEKGQISFKNDIYSLGNIIKNLLLGSNEITENWHESLDEDSPQMKRCIEIAQRCVDWNPKNRPTTGEIIHQLSETETTIQEVATVINEPRNDPLSPLYQIVQRFHKLSHRQSRDDSRFVSHGMASSRGSISRSVSHGMAQSRGSIAAFATYRPPCPWDIFSCPVLPSSGEDKEISLTDGVSYNHNCQPIPVVALRALIAKKPELASECGATADDVAQGRATGLVFVSERDGSLETLHVALRCNGKVKVLSLADIYGANSFGGVRMEDSGCFGTSLVGHYADPSLIYVSTKKTVGMRRTPWTAVYRTNLRTGETKRLTPDGQYDLSPAVSPSGTRVAVASFQSGGWTGEVEHLKTDIVLMNVDRYASGGMLDRSEPVVKDGGWPSWGSDNIIFFHRGIDLIDPASGRKTTTSWGVFRYDLTTMQTDRVTPAEFDAMTPAAISETKVAVATIRRRTGQMMMAGQREEAQYRHIEIFDVSLPNQPPVQITQKIFPKADYYSPFVLDGGSRIGYHRVRRDKMNHKNGNSDVPRALDKMQSPHKDVGLFRVSCVFPTFSADGSKLAFVDNEFKAIWLADKQGLRVVWETRGANGVFSTVWNQNPDRDTLYFCAGPSFSAGRKLEIHALFNVSAPGSARRHVWRLTNGGFNNAFPSSNPDGTKIVFRSTRDHQKDGFKYKNLYIMEDAQQGEFGEGTVTRLTDGPWTDTQCQWSPRGDWIVFSSTRDKPATAPELDNGLDPGHFAIYLLKATDPTVVVRVVTSGDPGPGASSIAGHVNHPVFSPDGRSIAFSSDAAAVSAEPISMPMFLHAVRPYGDIFSVDIDPDDICANMDINTIHRVTHSRYEYSTPAWTRLATDDPNALWNVLVKADSSAANYKPACPYVQPDGGESWHMTGHLIIPKRCC